MRLTEKEEPRKNSERLLGGGREEKERERLRNRKGQGYASGWQATRSPPISRPSGLSTIPAGWCLFYVGIA